MKLPWKQSEGHPGVEPAAAPGSQSCPTLARALQGVFRKDKPQILDLGPLCGDTVVFLADRGARVFVDELELPSSAAPPEDASAEEGAEEPDLPLPRVDQPDGAFDLVLAWEHCDFVPAKRLADFGAEMRRLLAADGWLLLFSLNRVTAGVDREAAQDRPWRYRMLDDDKVAREPVAGPERPRWVYPTRTIEQALSPLVIHSLHLQRNQMREFLAHKKSD